MNNSKAGEPLKIQYNVKNLLEFHSKVLIGQNDEVRVHKNIEWTNAYSSSIYLSNIVMFAELQYLNRKGNFWIGPNILYCAPLPCHLFQYYLHFLSPSLSSRCVAAAYASWRRRADPWRHQKSVGLFQYYIPSETKNLALGQCIFFIKYSAFHTETDICIIMGWKGIYILHI